MFAGASLHTACTISNDAIDMLAVSTSIRCVCCIAISNDAIDMLAVSTSILCVCCNAISNDAIDMLAVSTSIRCVCCVALHVCGRAHVPVATTVCKVHSFF